MSTYQGSETPSTSWAWKRVKVGRPAGGQRGSAPKALRWFGLPARNPREPLNLTVTLRGGSECWVEIHARGRIGRFHGASTIYDVVAQINSLAR